MSELEILIDTHVIIWIGVGSSKLSAKVLEILKSPEVSCYFSPISAWEMGVKYKLGKLPIKEKPLVLYNQVKADILARTLAFNEEAVEILEKLPDLHKDPFDRMLICQAITHNMAIMTNDKDITKYPIKTIW